MLKRCIWFLSKFIFTAKIFPLNFYLHIRENKQNIKKKETDSLISFRLADFIERVFVIDNINEEAMFCADTCYFVYFAYKCVLMR